MKDENGKRKTENFRFHRFRFHFSFSRALLCSFLGPPHNTARAL
jgi:hypothetical protein